MDDALCHLSVFASLPTIGSFTDSVARDCQRLCHEFQHYIIETHGLRKAFLSIKGIYYQAEVQGETITWLAPYEFSQHVPPNVDFRVMLTFLEFYQSLIGFVNFKLYRDSKLEYPPALNAAMEEDGVGLMALTLKRLEEKDEESEETLPLDADLPEARELALREQERSLSRSLFSHVTFFISREVPKDALIFVIKSFGGKVGWAHTSHSPIEESDPSITHHIVDRPTLPTMYMSRKYVQPQWVFDCINEKNILKEEIFAPGMALPPHLSPFVEDDEDGEALGKAVQEEDEVEEPTDIAKAEKNYIRKLRKDHQDIPEEEITESVTPVKKTPASNTTKTSRTAVKSKKLSVEEQERNELALSMMSKKKRKLYESMQRGIKNKSVEKERLVKKREKIAKSTTRK